METRKPFKGGTDFRENSLTRRGQRDILGVLRLVLSRKLPSDIAQDDRGIEFYQQRKHFQRKDFRRFEKIFVAEHFAAASDIYSLEARS